MCSHLPTIQIAAGRYLETSRKWNARRNNNCAKLNDSTYDRSNYRGRRWTKKIITVQILWNKIIQFHFSVASNRRQLSPSQQQLDIIYSALGYLATSWRKWPTWLPSAHLFVISLCCYCYQDVLFRKSNALLWCKILLFEKYDWWLLYFLLFSSKINSELFIYSIT